MARLPTVNGDTGTWGTVLNDYLSVSLDAAGNLKYRGVNAKDHGAVGDGVADDTAELQAAIDAAGSGVCYIPAGTYKVSSTLNLPAPEDGFTLTGAGSQATIISSTVTNAPILRADPGDTLDQHGMIIEKLGLEFATQRSSAQTDAYGIQIKGSATISGVFHWTIRNVRIWRSYIGIGLSNTGNSVIWGSTIDSVEIYDSSGYGMRFWCTGGAPRMLFRNVIVWNSTGGMAPTGAAIAVSPMYAHFDGVEVLAWHNQPLIQAGGITIPIIVDNFNSEACLWDNGGQTQLFDIYDGGALIRQASVIGTASASTDVILVNGRSGGTIDVAGLRTEIALSGGAQSAAFANCADLTYRDLTQTTALSYLYWDTESSGSVAKNHSATLFTKAGAPTDADFTSPTDGLMAIDTTNSRLYVRSAGTWKFVAVA